MTETIKPAVEASDNRYGWLTPDALARVRAILLGVTLFVGLTVYVFHTLGQSAARPGDFISRLQGVGVLTWLYALAQMIDMRFYNSRFAQRRRRVSRNPRQSSRVAVRTDGRLVRDRLLRIHRRRSPVRGRSAHSRGGVLGVSDQTQ